MPMLPLFPLSTVLYPGLVMPLHIFEPRYRALVEDLTAERHTDRRAFGVVAIKHGRETGADNIDALYSMGCTARLRRVNQRADGTYDITVVGTDRFVVMAVDRTGPYLVGVVDPVEDPVGELPDGLPERVATAFGDYLDVVLDRDSAEVVTDLPTDPATLSYLVAATMALPLPERQRLLELPDVVARLRAELELLHREASLVRVLHALPATDLTRVGWSLN
jgi:Lon protease-like protein